MRKGRFIVLAVGLLLCVNTAEAHSKPTPELACQQRKLLAQGELEKCLAQNRANMLAGAPDWSAACRRTFKAELKATDAMAAADGASCRYTDNGDGTVSDLNTGLMWEKKTSNDGIHDVDNFYRWSKSGTAPDGETFTEFLGALNRAKSTRGVNIAGCFAKHCDWRLPQIDDLIQILDLGAPGCRSGQACIAPIFGPTQAGTYWSGTTDSNDPEAAWFGNFEHANGNIDLKLRPKYVRAVRGGL